MFETVERSPFLDGMLLIASPMMEDARFGGSVIFMCTHSDEGAMGLVINKRANGVHIRDLASQLNITRKESAPEIPVLIGGPLEHTRGFVLHSSDHLMDKSSLQVGEDFAMTGHIGLLEATIQGRGPRKSLLALGRSGWDAGQLEGELRENAWLVCDATPELVFDTPRAQVWTAALAQLGVNASNLNGAVGRA